MAKLSSFMICDSISNIQTPQGNIPQLIAPLSILRPPFIPGSFSFGISLGVTGITISSASILRIIIKSPDGEEVFNSNDINLGIVPQEKEIPPEYQGFVITTDIRNLVLPTEGLYTAEIFVNGECVGEQAFPVYRKGAQQ